MDKWNLSFEDRLERLEKILETFGDKQPMRDEGDYAWTGLGIAPDFVASRVPPPNETAPTTAFEQITNRIQGAIDRVTRISYELEEIGNRVFGVQPEGVTTAGEKVREPDGTLEYTLHAADWLVMALDRLNRAATRLGGV